MRGLLKEKDYLIKPIKVKLKQSNSFQAKLKQRHLCSSQAQTQSMAKPSMNITRLNFKPTVAK